MEGIQNFTSSIYKKSINKQNNTVDKNSKPGAKAIAKGYLAGSLVSYFVMVPSIISNKILQKVKNLSGSLSPNELAQVEKATEDTIKSSGLEEKGVSIVKTTKDNIDEVTRILKKKQITVFSNIIRRN